MMTRAASLALTLVLVPHLVAQSFPADAFSGLKARSIGPAVTSGRVMTIAVEPTNKAVIYIGAASGGVWKTTNGGASWQPIFDTQGSFSIGWVTVDPKRPNVVWVGTGEGNIRNDIINGHGVYYSPDAGNRKNAEDEHGSDE